LALETMSAEPNDTADRARLQVASIEVRAQVEEDGERKDGEV
jgi:hypothetical protein